MEKRYVAIWFPDLATNWFELRQPEYKNKAFVLCAPARGRKIITAANAKAQELLIRQGMVLADARAICPQLEHFDENPGLTSQLHQRIAERCIRFSPL